MQAVLRRWTPGQEKLCVKGSANASPQEHTGFANQAIALSMRLPEEQIQGC